MIACATVFWSLLYLGSQMGAWLPLALTVGTLALYRLVMFSHEIFHLRAGVLPGFSLTWNAVCGVPMMLPSYTIKSHASHHSTATFGTKNDPEYLPFGTYPQLRRRYLWGTTLVPLAVSVRALVLVPLAWVCPTMRMHLRERMTYVGMNTAYRPDPDLNLTRIEFAIEATATAWAWWVVVATFTGLWSWHFAALLLTCMTLTIVLNGWRTLQSHRYANHGPAVDARAQLRDSTTFVGHWLWNTLLCPIGQRYHAAHHLLPYLPYHALPEAHRRLIAMDWPGRSDYLTTFTSTRK